MRDDICLTCGEIYHQITPVKLQSENIPLCSKCINLLDSMGEIGFVMYFKKFLEKHGIKVDTLSVKN